MTRTLQPSVQRELIKGSVVSRLSQFRCHSVVNLLVWVSASVWLLLMTGCSSTPWGSRYSSVPPNRTGTPATRPPIATRPGQTASSVKIVPYAAIPRHAMVPVQTGIPVASGMRIRSETPALAQLAANEQTIDGRSVPLLQRGSAGLRSQASASDDLKFRGGRTIRNLTYVNLYVGGRDVWDQSDWKNIDKHLAAAMSDPRLNNVLVQYFGNQSISSRFQGSFFLSGWQPQYVTRADMERQVRGLHEGGALSSFDLPNTCFNFVLPRGTILGDPNREGMTSQADSSIPTDEGQDSTNGLAGYHGSIHSGSATIYYSTAVYSERLPTGGTNGIPAFDQNWKNVVATMYHQLQEFRTDPDVDDAIRDGTKAGVRFLGWTSDSGLEIGDHPILEATQLKQVFVEVPLADGSGSVPIQLLYSNAIHGPAGPLPSPNQGDPLSGPGTNPGPPSNPNINDPELAQVIAHWNHLEDYVKKAILRLVESQ